MISLNVSTGGTCETEAPDASRERPRHDARAPSGTRHPSATRPTLAVASTRRRVRSHWGVQINRLATGAEGRLSATSPHFSEYGRLARARGRGVDPAASRVRVVRPLGRRRRSVARCSPAIKAPRSARPLRAPALTPAPRRAAEKHLPPARLVGNRTTGLVWVVRGPHTPSRRCATRSQSIASVPVNSKMKHPQFGSAVATRSQRPGRGTLGEVGKNKPLDPEATDEKSHATAVSSRSRSVAVT
jgi:hypothetical protein